MPQVSSHQRIRINLAADKVLGYMQDISHLADYEPKVDGVKVGPGSEREGTYHARGKLFGLPWQGTFSYALTENGFQSELIKGALGFQKTFRR